MLYQIVVVKGPATGQVFDLDDGTSLVIGRGNQCNSRLNDASVSRKHCEVTRAGNHITIRDLGSKAGTLVNGEMIEQTDLSRGSIVQIGSSVLNLTLPDSPDRQAGIPDSAADIDRPLHELVGTTLGHWRIEETIGHGVTGIVFKARHTEKNRLAALKVITPMYSHTEEQRKRFVRAMKTMLPIRSPHIVRLYNAGISGLYCWAAMEFVDGEDLSQLIERTGIDGMLEWKEVWRVAWDIGIALQTGFDHAVIHRNVTPTNILRRFADQSCLLGDFMLAKALEVPAGENVTVNHELVGELPYMAPERTIPNAEIDTRSDIYGLGATCYALLTGQPPVSGNTTGEMIDSVRNKQPDPPKHYQLAVDELFQNVIMQMLAKNPAERPQTPKLLLAELERIGKFNNLSIT